MCVWAPPDIPPNLPFLPPPQAAPCSSTWITSTVATSPPTAPASSTAPSTNPPPSPSTPRTLARVSAGGGGWSRRRRGGRCPVGSDPAVSPPGGLSLAVEGPSKAEISCTDNQDGTCSVSYLPVLPGDYSIAVKYNEKHIAGSPFTARITGTGGGTQGGLGGHWIWGGGTQGGSWVSLEAGGATQRGFEGVARGLQEGPGGCWGLGGGGTPRGFWVSWGGGHPEGLSGVVHPWGPCACPRPR